jgi:hypothetical protein
MSLWAREVAFRGGDCRKKNKELKEAQECLRTLRARRDTLARPYVQRRLQALREALTRTPLNVAETNKAMREAISRIVMDVEASSRSIEWHHSVQKTDNVMFFSRHSRLFDND